MAAITSLNKEENLEFQAFIASQVQGLSAILDSQQVVGDKHVGLMQDTINQLEVINAALVSASNLDLTAFDRDLNDKEAKIERAKSELRELKNIKSKADLELTRSSQIFQAMQVKVLAVLSKLQSAPEFETFEIDAEESKDSLDNPVDSVALSAKIESLKLTLSLAESAVAERGQKLRSLEARLRLVSKKVKSFQPSRSIHFEKRYERTVGSEAVRFSGNPNAQDYEAASMQANTILENETYRNAYKQKLEYFASPEYTYLQEAKGEMASPVVRARKEKKIKRSPLGSEAQAFYATITDLRVFLDTNLQNLKAKSEEYRDAIRGCKGEATRLKNEFNDTHFDKEGLRLSTEREAMKARIAIIKEQIAGLDTVSEKAKRAKDKVRRRFSQLSVVAKNFVSKSGDLRSTGGGAEGEVSQLDLLREELKSVSSRLATFNEKNSVRINRALSARRDYEAMGEAQDRKAEGLQIELEINEKKLDECEFALIEVTQKDPHFPLRFSSILPAFMTEEIMPGWVLSENHVGFESLKVKACSLFELKNLAKTDVSVVPISPLRMPIFPGAGVYAFAKNVDKKLKAFSTHFEKERIEAEIAKEAETLKLEQGKLSATKEQLTSLRVLKAAAVDYELKQIELAKVKTGVEVCREVAKSKESACLELKGRVDDLGSELGSARNERTKVKSAHRLQMSENRKCVVEYLGILSEKFRGIGLHVEPGFGFSSQHQNLSGPISILESMITSALRVPSPVPQSPARPVSPTPATQLGARRSEAKPTMPDGNPDLEAILYHDRFLQMGLVVADSKKLARKLVPVFHAQDSAGPFASPMQIIKRMFFSSRRDYQIKDEGTNGVGDQSIVFRMKGAGLQKNHYLDNLVQSLDVGTNVEQLARVVLVNFEMMEHARDGSSHSVKASRAAVLFDNVVHAIDGLENKVAFYKAVMKGVMGAESSRFSYLNQFSGGCIGQLFNVCKTATFDRGGKLQMVSCRGAVSDMFGSLKSAMVEYANSEGHDLSELTEHSNLLGQKRNGGVYNVISPAGKSIATLAAADKYVNETRKAATSRFKSAGYSAPAA